MKSWFKKVKCPICNKKYKELKHELRLDTADGVHSMFICDSCADFFDKSAEVLKKRNKDEQPEQDHKTEDRTLYSDDAP